MRWDMIRTRLKASDGSSCTRRRKLFLSMVSTRASPRARTVTERTSRSKMAISPKMAPFSMMLIGTSPRPSWWASTSRRPSWSVNMQSPASPCRTMTSPSE